MNKRTFLILPLFAAVFLLSGCSLPGIVTKKGGTMANATFMKSVDGGTTWNPKMKIDEKKTIAGVDVLTMAVSPENADMIYLGTAANGLFMTKDGGENWTQVAFADKAYGLVFDPKNPDVMYGSGVLNGRAKIYKRIQEGQEWSEIYTEPSDGTVISTLAISKANANVLYAGTNAGIIIKTTDGGKTWVNLKADQMPSSPIVSIAFDSANDQHVFFASAQEGVWETKNGGQNIEDVTKQIDKIGNTSSVYTLTTDPYLAGVVYVGTGSGIFKRTGDGNWSEINVIASSKAFPIRSIAVNPKNSKEIIYSSSKAIYKSTNSGTTWATFQLDTSKEISVLKYNQSDPTRIYASFRSF
jgi:photosystem II stability/assembly factor-like uncharacterized protein